MIGMMQVKKAEKAHLWAQVCKGGHGYIDKENSLTKRLQTINAGDGVEKREAPSHCWWERKLIHPRRGTVWRFL